METRGEREQRLEDQLRESRKRSDLWFKRASDAFQRAVPGDAVVEWVRQLDWCPRCRCGGQVWDDRLCCEVGRAVGAWERREVAEQLMGGISAPGDVPTQGEVS